MTPNESKEYWQKDDDFGYVVVVSVGDEEVIRHGVMPDGAVTISEEDHRVLSQNRADEIAVERGAADQTIAAAATARKAALTSAKAKLVAGTPLTADEAAALTGVAP